MTTSAPATTQPTEPWRAAGEAWGHAATDWATLFEPYGRDAIEAVFTLAEVGPGTDLLDVACGSGYALGRATRMGATCAGLDASERLLAIAARRAPTARLALGSLFDLPFDDATFDVVTSFNGIWGGCEEGLEEMARVLRPGGTAAITFWGDPAAMDLRDFLITLGRSSRASRDELVETGSISASGEAERMITAAGLTVVERGHTEAVLEWPDDDTAWRALRSPGIVPPALTALGEDELRRRVMTALDEHRAPDGSWLLRNDVVHVVARKGASGSARKGAAGSASR